MKLATKSVVVLMLAMFVFAVGTQAQVTAPISVNIDRECNSLTVDVTNPAATNAVVTVELFSINAAAFPLSVFTVAPGLNGAQTYSLQGIQDNVEYIYRVHVQDGANVFIGYNTGSFVCGPEQPEALNAGDSAPFIVTCGDNGSVDFTRLDPRTRLGVETLRATPGQLARALVTAQQTRVNAPATSSISGMSIWGLTSGELQAVYRGGLGDFDFVFPVTYCGGVNVASLASVPPLAPTPVPSVPSGPGYVPPSSSGVCRPVAPNSRAHVVQTGQNLYRISIAYGTSISAIAAANGISNPNRIFAGQCLQIP
jgi:hypothetical protein